MRSAELIRFDRNADSGDGRLDPKIANEQVQILLETVVEATKLRPQSVQHYLGMLYRVLGRYCRDLGPTSQMLDLIRRAVVTPLSATATPGMCLTSPMLGRFHIKLEPRANPA